MTTRRLPLLGLMITSLVSSGAEAQSPLPGYAQPSSRQSAAPLAASATTSTQPPTTERSNWLKRLVIGQSENEEAKPNSVTFSNPSSRQPAAAHSATPAAKTASPVPNIQAPSVKQGSRDRIATGRDEREGQLVPAVGAGRSRRGAAKTEAPKSVVFAPNSRRLPPVESQTTSAKAAPTTASKTSGLPPTTQPAPQPENTNWFKRLVVGDAKENSSPTKTVQFAVPQPSSRQAIPAQLPTPSAPHNAQTAASKVVSAPKQAPQQSTEDRPGWLRRLVVGETSKAPNTTTTIPSTPAANPANPAQSIASQPAQPRQLSGLFPPPQAQATASHPNSLAAQSPGAQGTAQSRAAHVPHSLPGSQSGNVVIADSLNEARQSAQKDKIDPDSEDSVSLTSWISRLHRRPSSNETAAPRTNALAPAAVADRKRASRSATVCGGLAAAAECSVGRARCRIRRPAHNGWRPARMGSYNQAALRKRQITRKRRRLADGPQPAAPRHRIMTTH